MSIESRIRAVFVFVVLALLIASVMSYFELLKFIESTQWVEHTQEVQKASSALRNNQISTESAIRGYAITGRPDFLEPMKRAESRVPEHLTNLKKLVTDSEQQSTRLQTIEKLFKEYFLYAHRLVDKLNDEGIDAAQALISTGEGRQKSEAIRLALNELGDEEKVLLEARRAISKSHGLRNRILGGSLTSLLLLLVAIFYVLIKNDINNSREAAEKLRQSEEGLAITLDSITDGVIATDLHFHVMRMNPVAEKLTGWSLNEARGKSLSEILHILDEQTGELLTFSIENIVSPRTISAAGNKILRTREQKEIPISRSIAPIRNLQKKVVGVVVVLHDVSKERAIENLRAKSEARIRRTNQFLDAVVENIPNMIFVKEVKELRFERLNRAGEQLLGLNRSELIGKNDYDFFPKDEADFFQQKDRETLQNKKMIDIPEEPIETPKGTRWLHTKKVPIVDDQDQPLFLLGISEDITEQRQAHAQLQQAKQRTEAANRELEAFSYSVAHDLRAPLRSIDGFSQALIEDYGDVLDEDGIDSLHRVRAASQRMAQLIDDLLTLARISRSELRNEVVDFSSMARSVTETLSAQFPSREVQVSIDPDMQGAGDPRLLQVVLDNLIGNAWKFTSKQEKAVITLGSMEKAGQKTFFVRDNGAGFDMTYSNKMFEAFQRLHSAQEFDGTGIGLAIVERVIKRHGGRVWAEGAVNQGATFFFTLTT